MDPAGTYRFSDATDPSQMVLFEVDYVNPLLDMVCQQFSGGIVSCKEICRWVEDGTPYLARHMREALKRGENARRLSVGLLKQGGERRRKGTFPDDAIVSFPQLGRGLDA